MHEEQSCHDYENYLSAELSSFYNDGVVCPYLFGGDVPRYLLYVGIVYALH